MKRGLTLAGILLMSTGAQACGFTYADAAMTLAQERAIIIWDQAKKVEHFIRSSSFTGQAKDFGFILPTPTQPMEIEVANEEAFGVLESLMPRPTTGPTDAAAGGVEILEQKIVGDFEVTVLKANDGTAIGNWLKANGHKMRPALVPWLDYYAERGWVLTAFKYQSSRIEPETKAIRVSFKADRPHYPYKMPSDTWSEGHHRELDLFVVSQTAMRGVYTDSKVWETEEKWRASVGDQATQKLSEFLGTPSKPLELPKGLTVTRFENSELANNYDFDLTFEQNNPPYWALWLGLGALGWAGFNFYRRSKVSGADAEGAA